MSQWTYDEEYLEKDVQVGHIYEMSNESSPFFIVKIHTDYATGIGEYEIIDYYFLNDPFNVISKNGWLVRKSICRKIT